MPKIGGGDVAETFREQHQELQHLVRELHWLRNHNLRFKPGDPQDDLLLFAEGAIVLLTLERFLRVILGAEATDKDTLPNLLEKATGARLNLLILQVDDRKKAIALITAVRNTLLHANYEQAADGAKQASVGEYFASQYAGEVEGLYELTNQLFLQIDARTGKPLRSL